jgi:hypothetical protein
MKVRFLVSRQTLKGTTKILTSPDYEISKLDIFSNVAGFAQLAVLEVVAMNIQGQPPGFAIMDPGLQGKSYVDGSSNFDKIGVIIDLGDFFNVNSPGEQAYVDVSSAEWTYRLYVSSDPTPLLRLLDRMSA